MIRILSRLSLAALLAAPLAAQAPQMPLPMAAHHEAVARKLGLDEAQKATIHGVLARHKDALMTKGSAFHAQRSSLVDAFLDPAVDEATVRGLHEKTAKAGGDLLLEARSTYLEVYAVLTEAQRNTARTMIQEVRGHLEGLRKWFLGH